MITYLQSLSASIPVQSISSVIEGVLSNRPSGLFVVASETSDPLGAAEKVHLIESTPDLMATTNAGYEELSINSTSQNGALNFLDHPMGPAPFGREGSRTFGEFAEDIFMSRYPTLLSTKAVIIDQYNKLVYVSGDMEASDPPGETLAIIRSEKSSEDFWE